MTDRSSHEGSTCVGHEPCPKCGSKDNLARYDDGHAYCFSTGCDYYEPGDGSVGVTKPKNEGTLTLKGEYRSLATRKIKEETCKFWGYRVGEHNGRTAQLAYYFDPKSRQPVSAKVRFADKKFTIIGDGENMPLYGQWLWKTGGKMLTITEGEIDALTVSQLQDNRWPVVSIPKGSKGAKKALKQNIDWVDSFETIVLMFDCDDPGREAANECAELFAPGKVKIATLPFKDPNECLQNGQGKAVIDAMWNAPVYRPDGIIAGVELTRDALKSAILPGYSLPYPLLNEMMGGLREQELTLLTAGSGVGKSTFARHLAYDLNQEHGLTIGNVFLEESNAKTAQAYVALDNAIPLGKLRKNPSILTDAQWDKSLAKVVHNKMFFYNHFGSLESDHLLSKLRYLRQGCGCNFIILDHISIVISGQTSSSEGERRDIDILMTKLRQLIESTGVGIIGIVHLSQPEGKAHEEGGRVSLNQLRGSGALKQLSDNVIALERNQQSAKKKDMSSIRLLKCREFGDTGLADTLRYNRNTGILELSSDQSFQDETSEDEQGDF